MKKLRIFLPSANVISGAGWFWHCLWISDRVHPVATENCTNLTNPIPSISVEYGDGFHQADVDLMIAEQRGRPYYYVLGIFATVVR